MGKKKKKDGEDRKKKKDSGPSGCGGRAHTASQWGGDKSLKNAVINCGFLEALLIALDAEDAGLPGLGTLHKLENWHCVGSRLVEHGNELAVGKRLTKHHRTEMFYEDGPSAWMTKAKEALANKVVSGRSDARKLLIEIGERYGKWSAVPGGDISAPYRRMKAVAGKLDELKLSGTAILESLENEAIEGKLPWLFQSMDAADKRKQAEETARKKQELETAATKKAAEDRAKAGK